MCVHMREWRTHVYIHTVSYEVAHYQGFSNEKILTVKFHPTQIVRYLAASVIVQIQDICFRLGKYVFMSHNTSGRI